MGIIADRFAAEIKALAAKAEANQIAIDQTILDLRRAMADMDAAHAAFDRALEKVG